MKLSVRRGAPGREHATFLQFVVGGGENTCLGLFWPWVDACSGLVGLFGVLVGDLVGRSLGLCYEAGPNPVLYRDFYSDSYQEMFRPLRLS